MKTALGFAKRELCGLLRVANAHGCVCGNRHRSMNVSPIPPKLIKGLLAILLPFSLSATPITFVHFDGPGGIPRESVPKLINDIKAKFPNNITPRIRYKNYGKNFRYDRRDFSVNYFNFVFGHSANSRVHFLVPPFKDSSGLLWMAGFAKRKRSLSVARLNNEALDDRYWHSVNAAAHEIGHTFGLRHVSDCSIMDYGVLGCQHQEAIGFAVDAELYLKGLRK